MSDGDLYTRPGRRITPNFLFSFYIERDHWRGMDRNNMIKKLEDQIIPGVVPKKQEIANEVLNNLYKRIGE